MTRDLIETGLVIPLIVIALLAGMLGFFVTQRIAPPQHVSTVRLSVVGLPPALGPAPSPTPASTAAPSEGGGSGGGGSGSGSGTSCPAGCQCAGQPGGIVIICR